ncbi:hypothetical protein Taro_048112 [Colocasia esculenta]|uniref:Uncharacterized protein n=1 Tax=Colocasia esculenta TaxID=4460 RepID=A0A843X7N6_COLES|nr:hypothetical protein [Colocasia esculenta]
MFFGTSDSLDYANRWRSPHAEPASHSDRKSCSTRREISSPVIGITHKTPIRNRHSEALDEALDAPLLPSAIRRHFGVENPSFRTPKLRFYLTISPIPRFFGSSNSLDYTNRWRSQHVEPPSHSDRKSCSTRREISSQVVDMGARTSSI